MTVKFCRAAAARCTMHIRCYSCNTELARHVPFIESQSRMNRRMRDILDDAGLTRVCCRTQILTHASLVEDTLKFSAVDRVMDDVGTQYNRFVATSRVVSCVGTVEDDDDDPVLSEDVVVGA